MDKMDLNQVSQMLLNLQHQINTLASEIPETHQVIFDTADFSRAEDVMPRKRLVVTLRKVDQESISILIAKAKKVG